MRRFFLSFCILSLLPVYGMQQTVEFGFSAASKLHLKKFYTLEKSLVNKQNIRKFSTTMKRKDSSFLAHSFTNREPLLLPEPKKEKVHSYHYLQSVGFENLSQRPEQFIQLDDLEQVVSTPDKPMPLTWVCDSKKKDPHIFQYNGSSLTEVPTLSFYKEPIFDAIEILKAIQREKILPDQWFAWRDVSDLQKIYAAKVLKDSHILPHIYDMGMVYTRDIKVMGILGGHPYFQALVAHHRNVQSIQFCIYTPLILYQKVTISPYTGC